MFLLNPGLPVANRVIVGLQNGSFLLHRRAARRYRRAAVKSIEFIIALFRLVLQGFISLLSPPYLPELYCPCSQ